MNDKAFMDTNLFIYMQSSTDVEKKELSYRALESFECVVSSQVLNEFCNVAIKKLRMDVEQIQQVLRAMNSTCEIAIVRLETVEKALEVKDRYGYSFYDSLIIASALESGCSYLFSEDMSDGQVIEAALTIVNIFLHPQIVHKSV
jgi:predicted nucleic acid-binding protein